MRKHQIAVLPGDNIGPEVTAEAVKCLQAAAQDFELEFQEFGWGAGHYLKHGHVMPPDALEQLRPFDAIYLGAVGDPARVPDAVLFNSGIILGFRQAFSQYVNLRPAKLWPGVTSPLADPGSIDLMVVRENTEGEYANMGGRHHTGTPDELVTQVNVFTRRGTERVIRYAFELARQRRQKVTSVTKSNALRYSMVLWDEVFDRVKQEYPDVEAESVLADAMTMFLITRPQTFDVIVASNLFGDLLSDEASAVVGGIGLAASGNINPDRTAPSMFEPIHGSAPDIAGKELANPLAAIGAAALMLDFLGEHREAQALQAAIETTLEEAEVLTPDLGGNAKTREVGDAVASRVTAMLANPPRSRATPNEGST